jgi:hypothetical protein
MTGTGSLVPLERHQQQTSAKRCACHTCAVCNTNCAQQCARWQVMALHKHAHMSVPTDAGEEFCTDPPTTGPQLAADLAKSLAHKCCVYPAVQAQVFHQHLSAPSVQLRGSVRRSRRLAPLAGHPLLAQVPLAYLQRHTLDMAYVT